MFEKGHIKGAKNVPFSTMVNENGTLKTPEEIKKVLQEKGVDTEKPIVSSCTSAVSACTLFYALQSIG